MAVVVMQGKCADVPGFLLEMSTACSQLSPGFCWGDWKPPLIPHPRETKPCCRRERPMSCRARSSRRPAESRRWPQRPASPRPLPGLSTYPEQIRSLARAPGAPINYQLPGSGARREQR